MYMMSLLTMRKYLLIYQKICYLNKKKHNKLYKLIKEEIDFYYYYLEIFLF